MTMSVNINSSRSSLAKTQSSSSITSITHSPQYSPSLTQSASNSSTSPPLPSTPPRPSRSRTRYPDLGRVPLHRRGTSRTFECLEDLLKEAGYKETRIFTPEGERDDDSGRRKNATKDLTERKSTMKDGVGAVVGFLAGLVPNVVSSRSSSLIRQTEEEVESHTRQPRAYSPPASPLTSRQSRPSRITDSPTTISSTQCIMEATPRARLQPQHRSTTPVYSHTRSAYQPQSRPSFIHRNSGQSTSPYRTQPHLQSQPSKSSLHPNSQQGPDQATPDHMVHPRPSRAGAYLRHMASAPAMPHRPYSTSAVHRNTRNITHGGNDKLDDIDGLGSVYKRSGNGEGEEDHRLPPLPKTWLESVAHAVLFGGIGTYVGGPASSATQSQHSSTSNLRGKSQALRQTRSSISQASSVASRSNKSARYYAATQRHHKGGPTSQTTLTIPSSSKPGTSSSATSITISLAPPALFTQLEKGRAGRSEGEVTRSRVVCRSAPASRASSLVRGSSVNNNYNNKGERNMKHRGRDRTRRGENERVPSLARTRVEGDIWTRGGGDVGLGPSTSASANSNSSSNRYLSSGWGVSSTSSIGGSGFNKKSYDTDTDRGMYSSDGFNYDDDEDDDDEDGELTLERMLVPALRQRSIKSLRKHLSHETAASTRRRDPRQNRAQAGQIQEELRQRLERESWAYEREPADSGRRHDLDCLDQEEEEEEEIVRSGEDWGREWVRPLGRRRTSDTEDDD